MTAYCESCDALSDTVYRCSECGADLAGDTTTHGREQA